MCSKCHSCLLFNIYRLPARAQGKTETALSQGPPKTRKDQSWNGNCGDDTRPWLESLAGILTLIVGSSSPGTGDTKNPDVPNWNPSYKGSFILAKADQWFDPRAFSRPLAGTSLGMLGVARLLEA